MWKLYAQTAAEEGYQATQRTMAMLSASAPPITTPRPMSSGVIFTGNWDETFGRVPLHWQRPPAI